MKTNIVIVNSIGEKMPLVARFATVEYELILGSEELNQNHMTIMPSDKTHPTTYSSTTQSGKDNDRGSD